MAPVFQAAGVAQASTGASVDIPWPTHLADDIGIVVIEISGNNPSLTPPTGWAAVPNTPVTDVSLSTGSKLHVWWKRATSSAEADVVSGSSLTDHIIARLFTFRGCVTTGVPWDNVTFGDKTTASTTATVPSLTTGLDDTLITMIVGRPNDSASTTHFGVPVNSSLTNLGEAGEAGTANNNGGGFVVSYGTKVLPGATGTSTLTKTVSTTDTYVVLALRAPTELIHTVGTFALNGVTVGLLFSGNLTQQVGTFSVNGNDAILLNNKTLDTSVGTFTIAGVPVDLTYISTGATFTLNQQVGIFAVDGFPVDINKQTFLDLQTGTYVLSGNTLGFIRALALHSVPGSFSISGKDTAFSFIRSFNFTTGAYNVSGNNVGVNRFYQLNNQPSIYQVVGSDLDYFNSRNLVTLPLSIVTDFRAVGNFFWYQTTQTIQPVKYKITKRNEWILGRATHMGRRGL